MTKYLNPLDIPLGKNTPHYSTFDQNYIRRFKGTDILEYTGRIDRNGYKFYSSKENCSGCPQTSGCCNKKEYRTITRNLYIVDLCCTKYEKYCKKKRKGLGISPIF